MRSEEQQGLFARLRARLADGNTRFVTAALLLTVVVLVGLLAYWIVLLTELPSTQDLRRSRFEQATVVYAADGTELTRYQDRNRQWVPLEDISDNVVNALIAAEDHRFYRHHGIDVLRTGGAVLETLSGDRQGGSTITMQFARNAFPDIYDDWTLTRKVKEWITALRVESMYEKDEILAAYLNQINFGSGHYGIQSASHYYFNKTAGELNLSEAALLAALHQEVPERTFVALAPTPTLRPVSRGGVLLPLDVPEPNGDYWCV